MAPAEPRFSTPRIALVGNPNAGKSSLFNALTGLRAKVGNFPGVTVDKKEGAALLAPGHRASILDLPGTYSLYPKSADERVATEVLLDPRSPDRPDAVLVIADASSLKRTLLFCTQVIDLGLPTVVVLTMVDIARSRGISVDTAALERGLGVPVVAVNPRRGRGLPQLKKVLVELGKREEERGKNEGAVSAGLERPLSHEASGGEASSVIGNPHYSALFPLFSSLPWLRELQSLTAARTPYAALHMAAGWGEWPFLSAAQRIRIPALLDEAGFNKTKTQADEVVARYARIGKIMDAAVAEVTPLQRHLRTDRLDKVLLHPLWGNAILIAVLTLLFQSIFWLAEYPMTWVERGFAALGEGLGRVLPAGWLTSLFLAGILPGFGGVAVFVPQIAILFLFITVLEDSGYMARISFLTDRLLRSVGLGGRSVMPLVSGMACAVPAVMAARTIASPKERLITILVTPLMSCSARLPVYTVLIALVIPDTRVLGIFSLKGIVLMGLYLLGFFTALIVARVLSYLVKAAERTTFLMELPVYRAPRWKTVVGTMWEKSRVFVRDAGKIILIVSVLLWALASYGPPGAVQKAQERARAAILAGPGPVRPRALDEAAAAAKLEASYAGHLGKAIEPVIRPLGYDWKMGIALITSFAAREVFVGTMATLYSVGEDTPDGTTLRGKMRAARTPDGRPAYSLATGLSLLLFYAFALQCTSTLAVVRRETRSWKWPVIQFLYMGALAYVSALVVYQLLK